MGDDVETLQRALDALPADRVAHIKSLKEPWDKGVAKMKHWVGAEVVGICGASADELDSVSYTHLTLPTILRV